MYIKKAAFFLFLCLAITGSAFSQNSRPAQSASLIRLQEGILQYGQGNFPEAIDVLRPILESPNRTLAGEALFWTALSDLALNDYQKTIQDIETLEILDPSSHRMGELGYHKGRALFYLGRYNEAIIALKNYSDSFDPDPQLSPQDISKKASALYWIGESLYIMGQLDRAGDVFFQITSDYPQSPKYEASAYRIALINQKKIENELLDLLKWSHEESLLIMDEYQRRERAYDQAILSYQRRINDMLKDTRLADLEEANARYQEQLAAAEDRIHYLETRSSGLPSNSRSAENPSERLEALRAAAMEIQNELMGQGDVSAAREPGR